MKKILSFLILLLLFLANQGFAKIPPPPNQIYPANHATNIPTTLTFDWSDLPPASQYQIMVFNSAGDTIINASGLTSSSYGPVTSGILTGLTQYYWKVRATNGPDINWSPFWDFTTAQAAPPAPTLSYPPNDTTNMPVMFTFIWNPSGGATSYRLQVSTDANFNTTSIDVPGLTSTQYAITTSQQLAYGIIYYWRVNASNSGGSSGWSSVWHFSTIPAPPAPPNPQAPANHATNIGLTPLINWSDVYGADSYHLQVATDINFNNIVIQKYPTPSEYQVQTGELSGNTHYYWRVRSHNIGGYGNWSVVYDFTTMVAPPAAPVLVSPPYNSTCIPRNPYFSWNAVPTATSYLIQAATDSSFQNVVIGITVTTAYYQAPANALQVNTLYYWRVRANNSAGTGPFSEIWKFTTVPPIPNPPNLVYPCSQSGMPLSFTFKWNKSAGAQTYQIQVSLNSSFTTQLINQPNLVDSFYTVPPGILQGGVTYYWRVNATNCAGTSSYPSPCNFSTITTLNASVKVYLVGFYDSLAYTQVKDTISVYLANTNSPYTLRDSSKIYLGTNGSGTCSFGTAPSGSYYLVVRHRNHIETWSSVALSFVTGNTTSYDFTDDASKAYGQNMRRIGNAYALFAGDVNQDGTVFTDDYNILITQFGMNGYISGDLNGDNFVDGYDIPIWMDNFFKGKITPPVK